CRCRGLTASYGCLGGGNLCVKSRELSDEKGIAVRGKARRLVLFDNLYAAGVQKLQYLRCMGAVDDSCHCSSCILDRVEASPEHPWGSRRNWFETNGCAGNDAEGALGTHK